MKQYTLRTSSGSVKMTLAQLVEYNTRTLANAALREGSISQYTLDYVPKLMKKWPNWTDMSVEELQSAGLHEWADGVYLIPRFVWNLIPVGTELYSVASHTVVKKSKDLDTRNEVMSFLQYGFKPA